MTLKEMAKGAEPECVSRKKQKNKTRSSLIGALSPPVSPIKSRKFSCTFSGRLMGCGKGVATRRNSFFPVSGFSAS